MSTYDKFIASLSDAELKGFNEGYREFLLSEITLAARAKDNISVRKLAQMAGVLPKIRTNKKRTPKRPFLLFPFK